MRPNLKRWTPATFFPPTRDVAGAPDLDESTMAGYVRDDLAAAFGPANLSERDVRRLGLDSVSLNAFEDK